MINYTEGGVTVGLGGALESLVLRAVDAAQDQTVRELRAAADEVAASARAQWYGSEGVERRTGLSGDIRAALTVDATAGTIRVSVGSTDKRLADNGKPVPVYVHRPTATSTVLVDAPTTKAYFDAPVALRGPWRLLPSGKKWPQLYTANPGARDGKSLLPLFVRSPMRARAKDIMKRLGADIVRGAKGGSGG